MFVWNSIKCELQKVPLADRNTQPKLQAVLTKVISDMSANSEWAKRVARVCRSAKKRLTWIKNNNGLQIIGKTWRKQA